MITLDYNRQLQEKEKTLLNALNGLQVPSLLPTIASSEQQFRNKAKFVVTGTVTDPVIGLVGEDNLDQGRELLDCSLHVREINETLPAIQKFITLVNLHPYQIAEKKGELKGLILFHSPLTKETYLRLVVRSKESIDRIRKHKDFLLNELPHLKCLSVNIQPVAHALLEGEEEIFITERTYIQHKAGNVTLRLDPRAFVQTNQEVATKLYETAAAWIKEIRPERFMELFCGQGAFSFFAASSVKEGRGIEINADAVATANETAKNSNLTHLSFKSADAANVLNEVKEFKPDVLLVNPPRRGLHKSVEIFREYRPDRFIYSSCNYETLAFDLKILSVDYEITRVQIFDMFPHTTHFETLVELKRKN
jgi:23S rRNA (uracil747-C5)-methyltransferase